MEIAEKRALPQVEKQALIAGAPFRVLDNEPLDIWKTNYACYLRDTAAGKKYKPTIGRMLDDKFQIYVKGEGWKDSDLWKDWSIDKMENGKVVIGPNGRPRKELLFSNTKGLPIAFVDTKPTVSFYDRDASANVTTEVDECVVQFSKGLFKKLQEKIQEAADYDFDDPKYTLLYDSTKPLAERYSIKMSK